jgi:hypothetical protein
MPRPVMLVGVQSNQFPRSIDIARQFRSRGVGGFHVSGTLSMLPERDPGPSFDPASSV